MNKGTVINLNKNDLLGFFLQNKIVFMLTAAFIVGIGAGVLTYGDNDLLVNFGKNCFDFFIRNRQGKGFINIFTHTLVMNFLLLLTYFLCGTSLMGVVLIPILSFLSGFLYAVLSSYVCSEYILKGIAFNVLILLPPLAITMIVLLLAGKKSICFSFEFVKLTMPNQRALNLFFQFKEYCAHYLVCFSVCLISAAIDGLLSKTLIRYFDFI